MTYGECCYICVCFALWAGRARVHGYSTRAQRPRARPCARARLNTRDPVCSRPAPCVCSVYAANTDAAFWKQCNKENFAKMFSTGSSLQVYNISADTAEILDSNEEDDSEDEGEGRVPSTGATSYSEA